MAVRGGQFADKDADKIGREEVVLWLSVEDDE